jgi:hypothetical protein
MSVFCITSCVSVGCTFFDWSIHFLSGQQNFYQADQQQWAPLSQDPVLEINAHGHPKNHPGGSIKTQQQILKMHSLPQDKLYSCYPTAYQINYVAKHLGIPIDLAGDPENYKKITEYTNNDFNSLFEFCHQTNTKLIFVSNNPSTPLYHLSLRNLDSGVLGNSIPKSVADAEKERNQVFFKNSEKIWEELNLIDVWDKREQLALDTRPFLIPETNFDKMTFPHLWVSASELWYNGEQAALKMCKYLGLAVDQQRLNAWRHIYAKWQAKQLKLLEFCYSYQHIVDSIVNNWYYDIDLTFDQEVVIQHCLIYQHNLNLKTWQLTKFPNNTQDLHKLLETNTHSLGDY